MHEAGEPGTQPVERARVALGKGWVRPQPQLGDHLGRQRAAFQESELRLIIVVLATFSSGLGGQQLLELHDRRVLRLDSEGGAGCVQWCYQEGQVGAKP